MRDVPVILEMQRNRRRRRSGDTVDYEAVSKLAERWALRGEVVIALAMTCIDRSRAEK